MLYRHRKSYRKVFGRTPKSEIEKICIRMVGKRLLRWAILGSQNIIF